MVNVTNLKPVHVIGGGLAGSEAAWQLAQHGNHVILHEMRPHRKTNAHVSDTLAELVCSNSSGLTMLTSMRLGSCTKKCADWIQ